MPKDQRKEESIYTPYLFPTRPYTAAEIAELAPECVGFGKITQTKPQSTWAKYVRAVRGVWVKPALLEDEVLETKKKTGKPQTLPYRHAEEKVSGGCDYQPAYGGFFVGRNGLQ